MPDFTFNVHRLASGFPCIFRIHNAGVALTKRHAQLFECLALSVAEPMYFSTAPCVISGLVCEEWLAHHIYTSERGVSSRGVLFLCAIGEGRVANSRLRRVPAWPEPTRLCVSTPVLLHLQFPIWGRQFCVIWGYRSNRLGEEGGWEAPRHSGVWAQSPPQFTNNKSKDLVEHRVVKGSAQTNVRNRVWSER